MTALKSERHPASYFGAAEHGVELGATQALRGWLPCGDGRAGLLESGSHTDRWPRALLSLRSWSDHPAAFEATQCGVRGGSHMDNEQIILSFIVTDDTNLRLVENPAFKLLEVGRLNGDMPYNRVGAGIKRTRIDENI
jgi:hypothetical protein